MSLFRGDIDALMRHSTKNSRYPPLLRVALVRFARKIRPTQRKWTRVVRSSFLYLCCVGVAVGSTKLLPAFSYSLKDDFRVLRRPRPEPFSDVESEFVALAAGFSRDEGIDSVFVRSFFCSPGEVRIEGAFRLPFRVQPRFWPESSKDAGVGTSAVASLFSHKGLWATLRVTVS